MVKGGPVRLIAHSQQTTHLILVDQRQPHERHYRQVAGWQIVAVGGMLSNVVHPHGLSFQNQFQQTSTPRKLGQRATALLDASSLKVLYASCGGVEHGQHPVVGSDQAAGLIHQLSCQDVRVKCGTDGLHGAMERTQVLDLLLRLLEQASVFDSVGDVAHHGAEQSRLFLPKPFGAVGHIELTDAPIAHAQRHAAKVFRAQSLHIGPVGGDDVRVGLRLICIIRATTGKDTLLKAGRVQRHAPFSRGQPEPSLAGKITPH